MRTLLLLIIVAAAVMMLVTIVLSRLYNGSSNLRLCRGCATPMRSGSRFCHQCGREV